MKIGVKGLFLWYLVFYFLVQGSEELIIWGETDSLKFDSIFSFTGIIIFFIYALLTYSTLYVYFPKRKWLYCIIGIVITFFVTVASRYLIEEVLTVYLFDLRNYRKGYGIVNYFKDNYLIGVRYILFGAIYYFIRYTMYNQGREKDLVLEKQNIQLETLNAQINPHFLLNSINNIYSLVSQKSDVALDALDKLSEILKYNLYEQRDNVSLNEELNIVEKFIELQKLRYDYPLAIQITKPTNCDFNIPQFLLLTIVENAFKHGDLKEMNNPLTLEIESHDSYIIIKSKNKISTNGFKDNTGGIGLDNVKRRLDVLYEGKATLETNQNTEYFSIYIKIPHDD